MPIDQSRYGREHLLDVAFVVLPMLRPLRALRVLGLLRAGTAAAVAVARYGERAIAAMQQAQAGSWWCSVR